MNSAWKVVPDPANVRNEPFPHFVIGNVLPDALADSILRWFETEAVWHLHTSSFFSQYELDLSRNDPPGQCHEFFNRDIYGVLVQQMGRAFGRDMTERVSVTAHRLLPGQMIGIHTDEPLGDVETHRLIIQLNRGWTEANGGRLVFFSENDAEAIHSVVSPVHNISIGFELSDRSYHAVERVCTGVRYTIIFSFWAAHYERKKELPHLPLPNYRDLIDYLATQGAGDTCHSSATLLDHLQGVERILDRWGYRAYLRMAGLFHSVYGTEGFPESTTSDRENITNLIGKRAGKLVDHYCSMIRSSFVEAIIGNHKILSCRDGIERIVAEEELHDLVVIDLANIAELLPRLSTENDILANDCLWYRQVRYIVNRDARIELDTLFGCLLSKSENKQAPSSEAEQAFIAFLQNAGAGKVVHGENNLFGNLMRVRDQLIAWGSPVEVAVAGLAHCLYCWIADPTPANRSIIRVVLGERAERLVYLYSMLEPAQLRAAISCLNDAYSRHDETVEVRVAEESFSITASEIKMLIWIELACYMCWQNADVDLAKYLEHIGPAPDVWLPQMWVTEL